MEEYVIKLIVENQRGIMARIATVIARKGYNIFSACVGRHIEDETASIIIHIRGTKDEIENASKQLEKLIPVISSEYFLAKNLLQRELALLKVKKEEGLNDLVSKYKASILNEDEGVVSIEIVSSPEKVVEFISELKAKFSLLELSMGGTNVI